MTSLALESTQHLEGARTRSIANIMKGLFSGGLGAQVRAILAKYGADAHVYIPGVGSLSGFASGNFSESYGATLAQVGDVVGFVQDAEGSIGSELISNGNLNAGTTGWSLTQPTSGAVSIADGVLSIASIDGSPAYANPTSLVPIVTGASYRYTVTVTGSSGGGVYLYMGGGLGSSPPFAVGTTSGVVTATAAFALSIARSGISSATITGFSLKEVTGVHASQTTTANKPKLRHIAGKYSWEFDGTSDILNLRSIPFTLLDDHCIVAGCSLNALGSVDLFSITDKASALGGLVKLGYAGSGNYLYAVRDDAGALQLLQSVGAASTGVPTVLAGRKVAHAKALFVDGIAIGSINQALGTAILDAASLGGRALTTPSNFLAGHIYPVIVIKGTVSDADLLTITKFVGQLSGVTI